MVVSFFCSRNNDKTVRIFHLAENRVVTTLHVDVSTNHASISPNGQHLVVVGDSPEVYFYHPATSGPSAASRPSSATATGIGEAGCGSWILSSHPPLRAGTDTDALMSTSFSSSSLHCAVASQAGIITIFDTRYLSCAGGCSPLLNVLTSSRPFTEQGAVRSVQFSPAPWDLLVWAEHTGRVCVADARNNFTRRQVVDVLAGREDLVEVDVEEVPESPSAWYISQRLLGNPASTARRDSRRSGGVGGAVGVGPGVDGVGGVGVGGGGGGGGDGGGGVDDDGEDDDDDDGDDDDDDDNDDEEEGEEGPTASLIDAQRITSFSEYAELVYENQGDWLAARVRSMTPGTYLPPHLELVADHPHPQMLRSLGSGLPPLSSSSTPSLLRDYRERQIERERARQRTHDPPRRRNSIHPSYVDHSASTSSSTASGAASAAVAPGGAPAVPGERERARPPRGANSNPALGPLEQITSIIADQRRRQRRTTWRADAASYASPRAGSEGVNITGCTLDPEGRKLCEPRSLVFFVLPPSLLLSFPSSFPSLFVQH